MNHPSEWKNIYYPPRGIYVYKHKGTGVITDSLFISLIRMRSKRDIKMGRLCTPGGAVLGIVGGACDVPFSKW